MAISTGIVPVSPPMRDRIVPRQRPLGATLAQEQQLQALREWEAMRGAVLVRVPVTIIGAFPGSLRRSQLIERAELTVSEFFFTFAEGTAEGFAIAVDDIVDLTIVPDPDGHMRALRMRYVAEQETGCIQTFTIAATGFRRIAKFKSILSLAAAADIVVTAHDPAANRPRSLAISWPHVRRFSNELMVWSGTACGPVGGWLASARADCRVWMTTHSFFWCDVAGNGVNRVPVGDMLDVTLDLDSDTPVLAIAIRDGDGCRQDLLFGFDRREYGDAAEDACRSLADALHLHGVVLRNEPAPVVPWRPGYRLPRPHHNTPLMRPHHRLTPSPRLDTPVDASVTLPDEVLAWLDQFDPERLFGSDDPAPDDVVDWENQAAGEDAEDGIPVDEPVVLTPWQRMQAWEDACIEAVRALESGAPAPGLTTDALAPALAALATLIEHGEIDILDADTRARRMHDLAACRDALLALAQQQAAGIRSRSAILTERRSILARFATLIPSA